MTAETIDRSWANIGKYIESGEMEKLLLNHRGVVVSSAYKPALQAWATKRGLPVKFENRPLHPLAPSLTKAFVWLEEADKVLYVMEQAKHGN